MDVNDNSPRFDTVASGHTLLSILESAAVGSTFLLPSATDPDSPSFGVHRYDIASDSNKFGLSVTKKLDGFLDVRLRLREKLDRELRAGSKLGEVSFEAAIFISSASSIPKKRQNHLQKKFGPRILYRTQTAARCRG